MSCDILIRLKFSEKYKLISYRIKCVGDKIILDIIFSFSLENFINLKNEIRFYDS